ncbi:polygalacturonase, partial [Genlisea aurea]
MKIQNYVILFTFISLAHALGAHHHHGFLMNEYGTNFEAYPSHHFQRFSNLSSRIRSINVLDFGAKGDGVTDDSKALLNAWKEACSSSQDVKLIVPPDRNYLLKQLRFSGPCTSQVGGGLKASDKTSDYGSDRRHWIRFDSVDRLVVQGGGTVDGNGKAWWQNSCKRNKSK